MNWKRIDLTDHQQEHLLTLVLDRQEHCHNKITSNEFYEEGIKHSHLSSDDLFQVKEELTNLEILEKKLRGEW